MSVGTAFFPRTKDLNVTMAWGEWAGKFAAAVYADFHDIEYNAIREAVAMIDASPLFKYEIHGPDATRLVDRVITRDATKISVGQVVYTPWCNEQGKMIDDGTVARIGEDRYRVTSADPCLRWFNLNGAGLRYEIDDVTDTVAALALQGPFSRDLLQDVTGEDLKDLKYFRERMVTIAGTDVDVTRTGYTGDLGYELWIPADKAVDVWDAIYTKGQDYAVRPVGIRALDVSRVEAGLILIEADYTSATHAYIPEHYYSPFEIGLGGFVDFNKENFVGKRALEAEQKAGGPKRRLAGLHIDWLSIEAVSAKHGLSPSVSPMVVRDLVPLFKTDKQVGYATSTTWSPNLKRMIALASVEAGLENVGTQVQMEWTVEGVRDKVNATVAPMPFMDLERKRS